jgi:hypothetical protein
MAAHPAQENRELGPKPDGRATRAVKLRLDSRRDKEHTSPRHAPDQWLEDLGQAEAGTEPRLAEDGAAIRQRLRQTIADMQAASKTEDTPASCR